VVSEQRLRDLGGRSFARWVMLHAQSLHISTRPRVLIKGKRTG
jgi:hypothetical protein